MFVPPSAADLRACAQKLGMSPSDAYLEAAVRIVAPLANAYAALDAVMDEVPAVMEPRSFRLPTPQENGLGAWAVKTEIRGAALRIRPDRVIEDMLRGFGATVVQRRAAFQPEGGAYSDRHGVPHSASDHDGKL